MPLSSAPQSEDRDLQSRRCWCRAYFLAESGFGSATGEQLGAAERAVSAVFDIGRETGEWGLDSAGFALFAAIATNYDKLLHSAPLWAVTDASERLDRFAAGMSYQTPVRKRA
nr:hypothetical protein [Paraburkholderia terricola]